MLQDAQGVSMPDRLPLLYIWNVMSSKNAL
jgi:hypothetical protein